jgi:hypothetical protein
MTACLVGKGPEGRGSRGLGDSNTDPPAEVLPGRSPVGGLTCDSVGPVMTARARRTPLPAGPCVCPSVYRWLQVSSGRRRL